MKGTLKTKTATISMSRNEFINLWCHLTEVIRKDINWNLENGFPLTTSEETCKEFADLLEKMYDNWLTGTYKP